jgi:hypothetical protein
MKAHESNRGIGNGFGVLKTCERFKRSNELEKSISSIPFLSDSRSTRSREQVFRKTKETDFTFLFRHFFLQKHFLISIYDSPSYDTSFV